MRKTQNAIDTLRTAACATGNLDMRPIESKMEDLQDLKELVWRVWHPTDEHTTRIWWPTTGPTYVPATWYGPQHVLQIFFRPLPSQPEKKPFFFTLLLLCIFVADRFLNINI
jgi:hypothetical protein